MPAASARDYGRRLERPDADPPGASGISSRARPATPGAFSTLERLGLDSVAGRRHGALAGVRNHPALFRGGLALEAHGTAQGFANWRVQEGTLPTYQLAFLMADALIGPRGLASATAYFRSFSSSRDREKNFALAFGITLAEFETAVLAYLLAAPAAGPPA